MLEFLRTVFNQDFEKKIRISKMYGYLIMIVNNSLNPSVYNLVLKSSYVVFKLNL